MIFSFASYNCSCLTKTWVFAKWWFNAGRKCSGDSADICRKLLWNLLFLCWWEDIFLPLSRWTKQLLEANGRTVLYYNFFPFSLLSCFLANWSKVLSVHGTNWKLLKLFMSCKCPPTSPSSPARIEENEKKWAAHLGRGWFNNLFWIKAAFLSQQMALVSFLVILLKLLNNVLLI